GIARAIPLVSTSVCIAKQQRPRCRRWAQALTHTQGSLLEMTPGVCCESPFSALRDCLIGLGGTATVSVVHPCSAPYRDPETGDLTTAPVKSTADPADMPEPKAARKRLSAAQRMVLRALGEAVDEVGIVPPASNHIPSSTKTVTIHIW